jgi:hypothetical protein
VTTWVPIWLVALRRCRWTNWTRSWNDWAAHGNGQPITLRRERPHLRWVAAVEDRLAYASVGSMVVFLAFPPLLVVSWLLARWTIARLEERGEALGGRRWLLYPQSSSSLRR